MFTGGKSKIGITAKTDSPCPYISDEDEEVYKEFDKIVTNGKCNKKMISN
jgi:hypothetical protein